MRPVAPDARTLTPPTVSDTGVDQLVRLALAAITARATARPVSGRSAAMDRGMLEASGYLTNALRDLDAAIGDANDAKPPR